MGLAVLVYCYLSFLLGPLQASQASMISETAQLESKIASANTATKQAAALEGTAATSVARSDQFKAMIPAGAPIAWFPPRLKSFFTADEIEVKTVSLINIVPFKETQVTAHAKSDWSVEIPRVDFLALGRSLARFENEEPLSAITSLRIHTIAEDPGFQQVTLGVNRIVVK